MGQQSSSNDTVLCCTARGDDEARPGDNMVYASCEAPAEGSPSMMAPKLVVAEDNEGGTGGTGYQRDRQDSNLCEVAGLIDLGAFACVEDRGAHTAVTRRALFGDKAVRTKVLRLKTCETEVEALMQIRSQIAKRLPAEQGKTIAVPPALEAGTSGIPEAELVRRLRLHEESLAGVPENFVTQACARVLGTLSVDGAANGLSELGMKEIQARAVEMKEIQANYMEILNTVDVLVQERISQLHLELEKLDAEVGQIEDLIALCFDKMDEEATGSIDSPTFVTFVCEQETHEVEDCHSVDVSQEDAESLFIQMSHGQSELTFDQFKDEITAGCLQVMQSNIALRRHVQKRYRDYWF